ncbi:hypothetical protein GCM10022236_44140 [Microlunatus ginsengisoli]|uniref:Uncharacterized protein n=1 Tax=Microlunatus ginsengisoli TaxID=363863 RepID=A0ABP7ANM5_9ACTN
MGWAEYGDTSTPFHRGFAAADRLPRESADLDAASSRLALVDPIGIMQLPVGLPWIWRLESLNVHSRHRILDPRQVANSLLRR